MAEYLMMTPVPATHLIKDFHIDLTNMDEDSYIELTGIDDDLVPATTNQELKSSKRRSNEDIIQYSMKKKFLVNPLIISITSSSGTYQVKPEASILSFSPIHENIKRMKFSKQRVINGQKAFHQCEQMARSRYTGENHKTYKIHEKIALSKLKISKLRNKSDELKNEIETDHIRYTECLQQTEMELQESTNEYETIKSFHKKWCEELDNALKSDDE